MRLSSILAFLLFILLASCAPQKYGRHFGKSSQKSSIRSESTYQEEFKLKLDSLVMKAATQGAGSINASIKKNNISKDSNKTEKNSSNGHLKFVNPETSNSSSVEENINASKKRDKKGNKKQSVEPLGVFASILSALGLGALLVGVSGNGSTIGWAGFISIMLAGIIGVWSLSKIKKSDKKLKGKGFGKISLFVSIAVLITIIISFTVLIIYLITHPEALS